jgi:hypothetical protein
MLSLLGNEVKTRLNNAVFNTFRHRRYTSIYLLSNRHHINVRMESVDQQICVQKYRLQDSNFGLKKGEGVEGRKEES